MRSAMNRLVLTLLVLAVACGDGGGGPGSAADAPDLDLHSGDVTVPDEATGPDGVRDGEGLDAEAGADAGPDPAVAAECKHELEIGESGRAYKCFLRALDDWPGDLDLTFGAALSELVYAAELSIMITSAPAQMAAPEEGTTPAEPSQNEYLAAEIHSILMKLRAHFVSASDRLATIEGRGLRFEVGACPIFLGLKPSLNARGVFDDGDVLLMEAIASAIIGTLDVLAGQDLDTEVLDMVGFVKDRLDEIDFESLGGILAHLLNADERFLTLHPDDGIMLFHDARDRFASAGTKLLAAIDRIREEGTDGDQVTVVEDAGASVRLMFAMGVHYGPDGTTDEEVLSFELSPEVIDGFRNASESLTTLGRRTTLHGGVFPVLSAMVVTAARSGVLRGMNVDLPVDVGAFEIGALSSLLAGLVPNVLAFDWGTFFTKPVGLRAWLPRWTTGGGVLQDRLVTEWECPGDLDAEGFPSGKFRMLCGEGATIADGPHFVGEAFATEADGVASPLPVFAFDDPTFGGLLYVNLAPKPGTDDASTYLPADGTTVNAALGKLVEGVLPLLLK